MKIISVVSLTLITCGLLVQDLSGSGRVDRVATLVARACPGVTLQVLDGGDLQDRLTVEGVAAETWVTGESVGDLRITLWKEKGGTVRAEVAQVSEGAGSVCKQLKRLFKADPSLSPDAAAERIDVQVDTYSSASIPELTRLLNEATQLELGTALSDSIFFPSRRIRLKVTNGMEVVSVEFHEPEPTVPGVAYSGSPEVSQPEVSSWVRQLLRVLGLESTEADPEEPGSPDHQ